jgi:hypothetical protein
MGLENRYASLRRPYSVANKVDLVVLTFLFFLLFCTAAVSAV